MEEITQGSVGMESEAILPDGWTEDSDIFDPRTWGGTAEGEDASRPSDDPSLEDMFNDVFDSDRTTGESGTENSTADNLAGTTQQTGTGRVLKFHAQFDHQGRDVELNEADLPDIWQKAQKMEQMKAKYWSAYPDIQVPGRTR